MMQNLWKLALRNKHTSGAAVVGIIASAIEFLGPLWFPSKARECEETGKWLFRAAGIYGLAAAGDAGQSLSRQEAQTDYVQKAMTTKTGTSGISEATEGTEGKK